MNTTHAALAAAIAMRRRSDQGRSPSAAALDPIAASFEVGDEAWTELAAQVVDVNFDRVAGDVIVESIQLLLDLRTRDETTRPAHQQLDHGIFARGERRRFTLAGDRTLPQVEGYFARGEHRFGAAVGPARYGSQPRAELVDVEWLDQVVVRPRIEATDAIADAIPCRHDDDRCGASVLPQPAQHTESVAIRQPEVEHQRTEV